MIFRWTDEANDLLRAYHAEGRPFTVIADLINRTAQHGVVTRNACIGRANRLGLQHVPFGPLSFMQQRESRCRWPITKETDIKRFRVCGCICKPTKPYCDEHSAKAYQPSRPRQMPQDRQNATHASAMFFKERV